MEINAEAVDALDGLLEVAIDDERFDKQLKVLERKQLIAKVPEDKKAILSEMGRIWEVEIVMLAERFPLSTHSGTLPGDEDALVGESALPGSPKIMRHCRRP